MTTSPVYPIQSATDIDPDLERITRAVDAFAPSETRQPAYLYGVPHEGDPILLGKGDPHRLLRQKVPPAGLRALALVANAWAGSLDSHLPPSQQPERRHCRQTAVVDDTGVVLTMLRIGNDPPALLPCDIGRIPAALLRCWNRRTPDDVETG